MAPDSPRHSSALRQFIASESAGGVALCLAAAVAMAVVNSPLGPAWRALLHRPIAGLTVHDWVNEGLMALFFLMVGLEIKRELVGGALGSWRRRALPGLAALGGIAAPALIYTLINLGSADTRAGWAIPSATDIAFALGVLALLGSRAPASLKIFLTALAILDDLGAILIIGLFYADGVVWTALGGAALMLLVLVVLNRLHVMRLWLYLAPALGLWWFLLHSGVHATLAGVAVAMTIPVRRWPARPDRPQAPLHELEHALGPWVGYLILPAFALANAGVEVGVFTGGLTGPAPLGVMIGLFVGKQVGVLGSAWLAVRLGLAERPAGASWTQVYGVSVLCGIGFTMSLFIGALAFDRPELVEAVKGATLTASVLAAALGAGVLWLAGGKGRLRAD